MLFKESSNMPHAIGDIYNAIEMLKALQAQETMDGPERILFMLVGVFSIVLMLAFFITRESEESSKGQKISMGFTMAWMGVFALMLFKSVPISDSELSAMNTLRELRNEQAYSHNDYINFVILGNEIMFAEKFVEDVEDLQLKLDTLGVGDSEQQAITMLSQTK